MRIPTFVCVTLSSIAALSLLTCFPTTAQDRIEIKSGKILKGTVVSYENGTLRIIGQSGQEMKGPINDIKRIVFDRESHPRKAQQRTERTEGTISASEVVTNPERYADGFVTVSGEVSEVDEAGLDDDKVEGEIDERKQILLPGTSIKVKGKVNEEPNTVELQESQLLSVERE